MRVLLLHDFGDEHKYAVYDETGQNHTDGNHHILAAHIAQDFLHTGDAQIFFIHKVS